MERGAGQVKRRGVLLDVMSTLVHDPIFTAGPRIFGCGLPELFARLDPEAWVDFELGRIDEPTYFERWLRQDQGKAAGPAPHPEAFLAAMTADYAWLPGIEDLLADLRAHGVPLHVLSNYPPWWQRIEARLGLSRYLPWTAVSCALGLRKPDPAIYAAAARRAGLPPGALVFVDDRASNVRPAVALGMAGVVFTGAADLRRALSEWLEIDL